MKDFLNRYGTPLTTGLFMVSTLSGVALFFHWSPRSFHAMHEWLSMILLLPFAVHLWKNWRALMGYAKRKTLILPLALCIILAIPFAIPLNSMPATGGNPAFRAISSMTRAPIRDLAPILQSTPEGLTAKLAERGITASPMDTLENIAKITNASANDLLFSLLPGR